MPDIPAGALFWLSSIERRVSPVSLATRAAALLPIDPLSPSGDCADRLCLEEG
ncbi:MAG: hypothetical protein WCF33_08670 [Pseudonocardiaceae bacterium]